MCVLCVCQIRIKNQESLIVAVLMLPMLTDVVLTVRFR